MIKNIIVAIVAFGIGAAGYSWYASTRHDATPQREGRSETIAPLAFRWEFTSAGEDVSISAPKTSVVLVVGETTYEAGTYYGNCREMDPGEFSDGEVAAAMCWWAGYGDEVGVFEQEGKLVLKHGEHMEPTAETPAFRGNFTTLLEIGR